MPVKGIAAGGGVVTLIVVVIALLMGKDPTPLLQQSGPETGDVEEALNAANAIGDDTLRKQARGYVVPDSFTHGTSAQRVRWFRRGLESGDVKKMNELFELPYDRL